MTLDYDINDVRPYINWDYFFYAWGMHNKPAEEKEKLRREGDSCLDRLNGHYATHALFHLFPAYSDGDDVIVLRDEGVENGEKRKVDCEERIPFLRQQQPDSDFLCLSDFIAPKNFTSSTLHLASSSQIGIFATSVDMGLETDFDADPYKKMMVQLLADRLAEATAELMHLEVRRRYWGYAPDEQLTIADLHVEKFQGIRPAVGYPSLPDTSLNFVIDKLLDLHRIGIRLTESGAMKPHASVSGLMISHPEARYFSLGKIGDDQLRDYARRRGLPVEVCRKFLYANL